MANRILREKTHPPVVTASFLFLIVDSKMFLRSADILGMYHHATSRCDFYSCESLLLFGNLDATSSGAGLYLQYSSSLPGPRSFAPPK